MSDVLLRGHYESGRKNTTKEKGLMVTMFFWYSCRQCMHCWKPEYLTVEHQLDPLSENDGNRTPLSLACETGHLDIVRYLVDEQSVDPNYGSRRWPALHAACRGGHLEVVKFLVEEKECDHTQLCQIEASVYSVLDLTAIGGQVDTARYLIEQKHLDPIGNTASTHTPLELACKCNCLEMVKYLVNEKSIDPLDGLNDGSTPFHTACVQGHLEIVKFLIEEKGCDPMFSNGKYPTPYGIACAGVATSHGNLDVIRYLTEERQCDPLYRDWDGVPAVRISAGNVELLKYFIEERGCDLEASGEYNLTLRGAIKQNCLEAFQYLSTMKRSSTSKFC